MFNSIKQQLKQGKTLLQFTFLKGIGQALGMVAPLVVAKFFSPQLFGSYSLAKMIVFFFSTILIASSQTPFIVLANQERVQSGKINRTFSVQCTFLISGFCIFVGIVWLFGRYITAFTKIERGDLLFVLLAFVGLALKTFMCNLFMAMGRRIKNSLVELMFGSLTVFFILVLYLTGTINLRTVFLVYFVSTVLVFFTFIKSIDLGQLRPFTIDRRRFRDMFDFAKWIMLGATAVYFINWGDNLVLRFFVSMRDIGTYNLAYQAFKGVAMLIFIINSYFLPFVSQHIADTAKMKSYLFSKRPKILLVGLIAIGLFFVVVPGIFRLVYGELYRDSVTVLRILLIGSVPILYIIFYSPILNALKKYKFLQCACMLQVLLNLILDLLLVPPMGPAGAAIATALAYFCLAIIMELYFRVGLKKLLKL